MCSHNSVPQVSFQTCIVSFQSRLAQGHAESAEESVLTSLQGSRASLWAQAAIRSPWNSWPWSTMPRRMAAAGRVRIGRPALRMCRTVQICHELSLPCGHINRMS